jgi:hypothetical protein
MLDAVRPGEGAPAAGERAAAVGLDAAGPARDDDHELDAFEAALIDLDLSSKQLRADPDGTTWLPASLAALVAADPRYLAALREFVAVELELYDGAAVRPEAAFTARVMSELPPPVTASEFDMRRTVILAAFHALAIGVAWIVLAPRLAASGGVRVDVGNLLVQLQSLASGGVTTTGVIAALVGGAVLVTLTMALPQGAAWSYGPPSRTG